jgi:hypothetical protein
MLNTYSELSHWAPQYIYFIILISVRAKYCIPNTNVGKVKSRKSI